MIIAPSLLAADFMDIGRQLQILEEEQISVLHVDVMDGLFVPSISFGMPVMASLRPHTDLYFDVHLMIQDPIRYIAQFKAAGANSITVHVEACPSPEQALMAIRREGAAVGITLKPGTSLNTIIPYLPMVDQVLVMSVEPGFGGQTFMLDSLDRIQKLFLLRKEHNLHFQIEVDGGINSDTLSPVQKAGADVAVAGTAVFKGDIRKNLRCLRDTLCPKEEQP